MKEPHRSRTVTLLDLSPLVGGLGKVEVTRHIELAGDLERAGDGVGRGGVQGVRCGLNRDKRITLVFKDQLLTAGGGFMGLLPVARRRRAGGILVIERAREHESYAGVARRVDDSARVVVAAVVQIEEIDGRGDTGE